jgi:phage baseplate assembly protein V
VILLMNLTDLTHWLSSLVQIGKIVEADASNRYKAEFAGENGSYVSGWLYKLDTRAGDDGETWFYDIGEQVAVISLGPFMEQGLILGSINQAAYPPVSDTPGVYRRRFGDGTEISYDRDNSVLSVDAVGDITVAVGGNAQVTVEGDADVDAQGEARVNGAAIRLNGGTGVITAESRCHFTGLPHADCSQTVFAGKVGGGG